MDMCSPIDLHLVKSVTPQDLTMDLLKDVLFKEKSSYRRWCPHELWDYWNLICDLGIDDGPVLKT